MEHFLLSWFRCHCQIFITWPTNLCIIHVQSPIEKFWDRVWPVQCPSQGLRIHPGLGVKGQTVDFRESRETRTSPSRSPLFFSLSPGCVWIVAQTGIRKNSRLSDHRYTEQNQLQHPRVLLCGLDDDSSVNAGVMDSPLGGYRVTRPNVK